jgi:exopolysaccharide production protein ExoQ
MNKLAMPPNSRPFIIYEYVTVCCVLFLFSSNRFWVLSSYPDGSPSNDRLVAHILQLTILAASIPCFLRCWRTLISTFSNTWPLWGLCALAVLSALWSDVPSATFGSSLLLLATTAFGVYFGARFQREHQLVLLAVALGLIAIASLCCAIFFPAYGISGDAVHIGDWRGIFVEKNSLGRIMALACLVFLTLRRGHCFMRSCGFLLCFALLIKSGSRTAILSAALLVGCYLTCRLAQSRRTLFKLFVIAMALSCLCIVGLVNYDYPSVSHLIDRDATLTGRTDLWAVVTTVVLSRPWLGYGFDGVWGSNGVTEAYITRHVGWEALHAHNGFLDVVLALGAIGLAIFLCGFIVYFVRATVDGSRSSGNDVLWSPLFLILLFVYNSTEGPLLAATSIYWCVYVSVAVSVSLQPHAAGAAAGVGIGIRAIAGDRSHIEVFTPAVDRL